MDIEEAKDLLIMCAKERDSLTLENEELQARNEQLVEALRELTYPAIDGIPTLNAMPAAVEKAKQALSNQPNLEEYKARQEVIDAAIGWHSGDVVQVPFMRQAVTNLNTVMEKK